MDDWLTDNVSLVHTVSGALIGSVLLGLASRLWYRKACAGDPNLVHGEDRRRFLAEHMAAARGGGGRALRGAADHEYTPLTSDGLYALRDDPAVQFREQLTMLPDGCVIYHQRWTPAHGQPKAVVLALHGYGDHTSWMYATTLHDLCSAGYVVVAMDQRGFGQSDGLHGLITGVDGNNFEQLLDDTEAILAPVREEFAGSKFFLCGESMGGGMAVKLALRRPEIWDGMVLTAPMCKIADEVKPPQAVINGLTKVAPYAPTLPAIPTKDLLSVVFRTQEARELAQENPIFYDNKPRLSSGLALLNVSNEIEARLGEVTTPFLVLHGHDDVVTDPSVSQALYDQAASSDKTLRLYDDCWHALTYEHPEHVAEMRADVRRWLDERSAA